MGSNTCRYIGVGEDEQIQLFYYYIESEADPKTDPLVLWLTGGPGASGLSDLVLEIGMSFWIHTIFVPISEIQA